MLIEKSENMPCAASAIDGVRRLKVSTFCLLLCAISTAVSSTCLAETYYVDAVIGNDAYDGTSATDDGGGVGPWGTMGRALPNNGGSPEVAQGDTVIVDNINGENIYYHEDGDTGRSSWITYQAADPENKPSFQRLAIHYTTNAYMKFVNFEMNAIPTGTDHYPISLKGSVANNVTYLWFDNCDITGIERVDGRATSGSPASAGKYSSTLIDHCQEIQFTNCDIDNGMYGIGIGGGAINISITDCTIHNQWWDAISITTQGNTTTGILFDGCTVSNLNFSDSTGFGAHMDMLQTPGATTIDDVVIDGCTFIGSYDPDWKEIDPCNAGLEFVMLQTQHNGTKYWIKNSLFYGTVQADSLRAPGQIDGLQVINNTFATTAPGGNPETDGVGLGGAGPSTNVLIYNNISYWVFGTNIDGVISSGNNLMGYYSNTGSGYIGPPVEDMGTVIGTAAVEALFVDYNNNDFTLAAGSTAIDFGDATYAPATDILGNTRDANPDAGCYEYGASLGNQAPIADAGLDRTVIDIDSDGNEQVTLNGSASYDDNGIVSWVWTDDLGDTISESEVTTVILSVGTHPITLTVTDHNDLSATDTVNITVDGEPKISPLETLFKNVIDIWFDRPLDKSLVEDPNNYTINYTVDTAEDSIIVHNVSSDPNLNMARLFTSTHSEDVEYTLKADFIQDEVTYTSNLVGDWRFDEYSSLEAKDSSCKGNTATLVNGPAWTGQGDLSFDGNDDAVEISTADLDADQGTISLWAYAEDFSGKQYLFSHSNQGATSKIQLYVLAGVLCLELGDSDLINWNEILDLQTWYHITLTWNGTTYAVYVNGVEKASDSYSGLTSLNTSAYIGNEGNNENNAFNGVIDNVKSYNLALTADAISDLFFSEEVKENKSLAFVVSPMDGLTYSVQNQQELPAGAVFDPNSNTFTWKPWYDQAGGCEVTFEGVDGSKQVQDTLTITAVVEDIELSSWYEQWLRKIGLL